VDGIKQSSLKAEAACWVIQCMFPPPNRMSLAVLMVTTSLSGNASARIFPALQAQTSKRYNLNDATVIRVRRMYVLVQPLGRSFGDLGFFPGEVTEKLYISKIE